MAERKTYIDHLGEKSYNKEYLVNDSGYVSRYSVGVKFIRDVTESDQISSLKKIKPLEIVLMMNLCFYGIPGSIILGSWLNYTDISPYKFSANTIIAFMSMVFSLMIFGYLEEKKYTFPLLWSKIFIIRFSTIILLFLTCVYWFSLFLSIWTDSPIMAIINSSIFILIATKIGGKFARIY